MSKQSAATIRRKFVKLGGQFEGKDYIVWKAVRPRAGRFRSPTNSVKLTYRVGYTLTDPNKANTNSRDLCAAGLNVHATQPPCRVFASWGTGWGAARFRSPTNVVRPGPSIIVLECRVAAANMVCIPVAATKWSNDDFYTGGPKIRCQKLRVVAAYKYDSVAKDGLKLLEMAKGYKLIPLVKPKAKKVTTVTMTVVPHKKKGKLASSSKK